MRTQGEQRMNIKAEIELVDLQANECQRLPDNSQNWERSLESSLPSQPSRGANPLLA